MAAGGGGLRFFKGWAGIGLAGARLCDSIVTMSAADSLPDDVEALKAMLRDQDAELAQARATASNATALIAHLQLSIEKLRRELYGVRSERKARLLEQMELELEELEADAAADELAAEQKADAAKTTAVRAFSRRKPSRQPFPEHLPRERVVLPGPCACACCGGTRLHKLGEDVTETLEVDSAAMEGRPACAREVHLPRLRDDQPSCRRPSIRCRAASPARACWR